MRRPLATLILTARLVIAAPAIAATQPIVDYLYVEANEGQAAAGHVAIRFGDETFHFQHEEPGILRLQRDSTGAFDFQYATLENRSIHSSHIAVSDNTYKLLREAFRRRHVVEEAQLEIASRLHEEVKLFEFLRDHRPARADGSEATVDLPAVGWFLGDGRERPVPGDSTSATLSQLQARIRDRFGARFLDNRVAAVRGVIHTMRLRPANDDAVKIEPDRYPRSPRLTTLEWRTQVLNLLALEALQESWPLRSGSYVVADQPELELTAGEQNQLRGFATQLQQQLIDLLASRRDDWGLPFLVGMARLLATTASAESGRLVVLRVDDASRDATTAVPTEALRQIENATRILLHRARTEIFGHAEFAEGDYVTFEWAARRLIDVRQALDKGVPLTPSSEPSLATLHARRSDVDLPGDCQPEPARSARDARSVEEHYRAALQRLYAYNLIERNCVSEIFAVIAGAIAVPSDAEPDEAGLGGTVTTDHNWNFIPRASISAVDRSYRIGGHGELPSYRHRRLAELYGHENRTWAYLRESNTLSSTIYTATGADSPFLFFTDDAFVLRPLYGVANLLVGVGATAVGAFAAPFDRGARLVGGAQGVLFSLPELAFVNIRKGSFPTLPTDPGAALSSPNS